MTLSAWYEFNKPYLKAISFIIIVYRGERGSMERILKNEEINIDDALDLYGNLTLFEVTPTPYSGGILEICLHKERVQK